MNQHNLLQKVAQYYTSKLTQHGATHRGVDWNSQESQELRFKQLLTVVGDDREASVLDYGCGYGAMAGYMRQQDYLGTYIGFDISEAMVEEARRQQADLPNCTLFANRADLAPADYTIASGIFNVKLDHTETEWHNYIVETIKTLASLSTKGFAFNMLTSYSDADRMRPDLYYGDPSHYIDHCIRTYSRHVAMLHNYGLYEFTITVRLA